MFPRVGNQHWSREFTNALKGVTGCEEQSAALDLRQRRAASRAFYDPTTRRTGGFLTQATNLVRVFKDARDADQLLSAYKAPSAGPCLQQVNESALKSRNPSKDISITSVTPVTAVAAAGDDSVGYELVVTAADEQQSATDYMDLIWVRVGRVVVGFKLGTQQNELLPQLTNSVVHPVDGSAKSSHRPRPSAEDSHVRASEDDEFVASSILTVLPRPHS